MGEALVDLICERPVTSLVEADAFVPHFGGVVANVALMAARAGARVALAGGAGEDDWGRWLRGQLNAAGVDLRHFKLIEDMRTPLALTTVDRAGEPSYAVYGESTTSRPNAMWRDLSQAVAESGGLFISSNTLVSADERAFTMRARRQSLELGHPVMFDPNLRLSRWRSRAEAVATASACVSGALLVRVNAAEARLLTAEDDLERAAAALLAAGTRNVVISDGASGAMLRGEIDLDVAGAPAQVISTIGAGDALMATLIAGLQMTGYYAPAIAAALRQGMVVAARACERWGACE